MRSTSPVQSRATASRAAETSRGGGLGGRVQTTTTTPGLEMKSAPTGSTTKLVPTKVHQTNEETTTLFQLETWFSGVQKFTQTN